MCTINNYQNAILVLYSVLFEFFRVHKPYRLTDVVRRKKAVRQAYELKKVTEKLLSNKPDGLPDSSGDFVALKSMADRLERFINQYEGEQQ